MSIVSNFLLEIDKGSLQHDLGSLSLFMNIYNIKCYFNVSDINGVPDIVLYFVPNKVLSSCYAYGCSSYICCVLIRFIITPFFSR